MEERAGRIGKGPRVRIRTRDARSATALTDFDNSLKDRSRQKFSHHLLTLQNIWFSVFIKVVTLKMSVFQSRRMKVTQGSQKSKASKDMRVSK